MRDPFDKIVSQQKHTIRIEGESRRLSEVIEGPSDYLTNSYYPYQARPYYELFGRGNVYLDTFEALKTSPVSFRKRLFYWLGIDSSYVPPTISEHFNVSLTSIESLDENSFTARILRALQRVSVVDRLMPRTIRKLKKRLVPKKVIDFKSAEFQDEIVKTREILQPLLS